MHSFAFREGYLKLGYQKCQLAAIAYHAFSNNLICILKYYILHIQSDEFYHIFRLVHIQNFGLV